MKINLELIEINKKNENKINNLEKIINELKNKSIGSSEPFLFNSKIKINESLVKSWLNNRRFSSSLLFRMTKDGVSFDNFHNKCDNKAPTITFIETEEGFRFGGYTELVWDNYSKNKTDNSTFIFSFNYNEKYAKRNQQYSIGCYKDNGPIFGWGPQIRFNGNLIQGISEKSINNSFVLDNKFTDGKNFWKTKELEVFQINYY